MWLRCLNANCVERLFVLCFAMAAHANAAAHGYHTSGSNTLISIYLNLTSHKLFKPHSLSDIYTFRMHNKVNNGSHRDVTDSDIFGCQVRLLEHWFGWLASPQSVSMHSSSVWSSSCFLPTLVLFVCQQQGIPTLQHIRKYSYESFWSAGTIDLCGYFLVRMY